MSVPLLVVNFVAAEKLPFHLFPYGGLGFFIHPFSFPSGTLLHIPLRLDAELLDHRRIAHHMKKEESYSALYVF